MKKIIFAFIFLITIYTNAQTIIANPQDGNLEGGQLKLMNSNSNYNLWDIDNYAGNLRFFHSEKVFFNMTPNGFIGMGTINPTYPVDIVNSTGAQENFLRFRVLDAPGDHLAISNATGASGQFMPVIKGYHVTDNRFSLQILGTTSDENDNGANALVNFDARRNGSPIQTRPLFVWTSYTTKMMTMLANGSLGIGTTTTGSHKLAVEGSIGAREIKVQATGWSDFVFEDTYILPTLEEVEQHIQEKGHLQDIPSAKEVEENGIFLGEMDAKLLQKIEELTLYTIEQEKQLKEQKIEQESQQKRITDQDKKIIELENKINQLLNAIGK